MRKLTEQDIAAVIGKTQNRYTIIRVRVKGGIYSDSDHYGIALARNAPKGFYVTWKFHLEDEQPSFYWGHYMENPETALKDYEERS